MILYAVWLVALPRPTEGGHLGGISFHILGFNDTIQMYIPKSPCD